ncbi:hypothetical protein OAP14_02175 [Aliiglaciecola sp.]|nr:hypothetical protein [Aliiglaciecola sp.]
MRFNWFPWKFIVKRAARAQGFLDPIALLGQLQRFIQPSEVNVPIELLRAGAVLHARGLINSRVIQHNLDWVWPYWVERQFDPNDVAFIPRAFSITHINLTHRNWTAVGLPDYPELPIVDPRGLVTPFLDKWSLDFWLIDQQGKVLAPSKVRAAKQRLMLNQNLTVITEVADAKKVLTSHVSVMSDKASPECVIEIDASSDEPGWVVVALRPYNPEGISFVYNVSLNEKSTCWTIDGKECVSFSKPAERHHVSHYQKGDVFIHLQDSDNQYQGSCDLGMLTAAALFELDSKHGRRQLTVSIPLGNDITEKLTSSTTNTWDHHLCDVCKIQIPDKRMQFLFESAIRTLLLHSSEEIYPGPYTYKRFWFRDAVFISHALLCVGLSERVKKTIDGFSLRQDRNGYFHSQEGEWDSNGEVLWLIQQLCKLTNTQPKPSWHEMILKGSQWIINKCQYDNQNIKVKGLLPAGFSAEHLGPNDYYYWDDFWAVAGLNASSELFALFNELPRKNKFKLAAKTLLKCIDESLALCAKKLGQKAMPASPNRRLDAGAIGSLAIGYPTRICEPKDERLLNTVEFLLNNCCVQNGFFQDMTHSGVNPYLTLHIAQVLMRAGDKRFLALIQRTVELASDTGQWPEAIHPHTGGGCMGDGQHAWAAAEWILMIRNCFIREENDCLVFGSGIHPDWLSTSEEIQFGPALTSFGTVEIYIKPAMGGKSVIQWQANWYKKEPKIEVHLPEHPSVTVVSGITQITIDPAQ